MKVTLDSTRILHLLLLLGTSYLGGKLLVWYLDWTFMAAMGFSTTVVCQVSNAILQLNQEPQEATEEKAKAPTGGNPKKKKNKASKAE